MKLPKLDDLIDEQAVVYDHSPDEHLFVVGPPGSGKTSLAVLRANFLRDFGQDVVLVTRNRMLASLTRQLGKSTDARTMSTFVAGSFYKDHGYNVPQHFPYSYDWVAICNAYDLLKRKRQLDHLIVDEAQNLPADFFHWAMRFSTRTMTVFADEDQTTDPLRSSLSDIRRAGLPNPVLLTANHRNTGEIAAVAEHFHRSQVIPPSIVQRPKGGETPQLVMIRDESELVSMIVARYANRGEAIGLIVYYQAAVRRLKARLDAAMPEGSRVDFYTSATHGDSDAIQLLSPGVTILTSESVIGLEFDVVYLYNLDTALPCKCLDQFRKMYMLCARARNMLILINGPAFLSALQVDDLPSIRLLAR